jgi:hypothetical protein
MTVFLSMHKGDISMADYGPAADSPILAKGAYLSESVILALNAANVTEVELAPADPINIQCAQLCGLGHYRMMGQMKILEPDAFAEWYAGAGEEEEFFEEDFDE